MINTTADRSNVKMAARFAYAATGILANVFLIAFFALRASHPEVGTYLGSANDLVGSLGAAFMIPVTLTLSGWLPDGRLSLITQAMGVSAMAVLVVGGPLLVLGVLAFEVQAPIAMGAWTLLCLWLLLINRWSRQSGAFRPSVARLGEFLGAGMLAGGAVVGLGLLLPWMSWPQLILFGAGAVLTAITMLGTPFWFLLLGRQPGES